jgi:hypothetical protein
MSFAGPAYCLDCSVLVGMISRWPGAASMSRDG